MLAMPHSISRPTLVHRQQRGTLLHSLQWRRRKEAVPVKLREKPFLLLLFLLWTFMKFVPLHTLLSWSCCNKYYSSVFLTPHTGTSWNDLWSIQAHINRLKIFARSQENVIRMLVVTQKLVSLCISINVRIALNDLKNFFFQTNIYREMTATYWYVENLNPDLNSFQLC
jgi:hypothetical protein